MITRLFDNVKGWKSTSFFVADPRNDLHNWKSQIPEDRYDHFWFSEEQMMWFNNYCKDGIPLKGWSYNSLIDSKASGLFINASDLFTPSWVCVLN